MNMNEIQATLVLHSAFPLREAGFEFNSYSCARDPIGSRKLAQYAN